MGHTLTLLEGRLAVCRCDPDEAVPDWFEPRLPLSSLVRSEQDLTLVTPEDGLPEDVKGERGWRALRVEGPFDLTSTFGVIAGITSPLAAAEVSVLSISAYDTDYVLVQEKELDRATQALRDAGHEVRSAA